MNFEKEINQLNNKFKEINNPEFIEKQHQRGKLSAKERIDLLLDPNSFVEIDPLVETRFSEMGMDRRKYSGDQVIAGFGRINNRQVCLFSQDFSKSGGTLGELHSKKILKAYTMALKTGCPIIGIYDSGGARIQEGLYSLDGYGGIFKKMINSSGVIPQIALVFGVSAGGASYAPGLSDFVFMVEKISQMYITGSEVIKKVTGEEISLEDLGGSKTHSSKSGCAHFVFSSEQESIAALKKFLSYLPQNNLENPSREKNVLAGFFESEENFKLLEIVPEDEKKGYDIKIVINEVFDKNSFFEIQPNFAPNAVIGFARLDGYVVGVVANQPQVLAGVLDINSSDKIARFVRFCDTFNIPLINFIDTPGYLPGADQEHNGIIRHGAKVLYAFAEASVPKICLVLRKAFGGAYIALVSKALGYDMVIGWPGAQLAVMGAEQAVKIIFKKELAEAVDKQKLEKQKIEELKQTFSAFQAAKNGQIDLLIHPKDTRKTLIKCLEGLEDKREPKIARKHGNIPL